MTFKELIKKQKEEINDAAKLVEESKDPFKNVQKNDYFFILSQQLAMKNKDDVEADLKTIEDFLLTYHIDENEETDGLEFYLFRQNSK